MKYLKNIKNPRSLNSDELGQFYEAIDILITNNDNADLVLKELEKVLFFTMSNMFTLQPDEVKMYRHLDKVDTYRIKNKYGEDLPY